jgi:hypothetical protein
MKSRNQQAKTGEPRLVGKEGFNKQDRRARAR